MAVVTKGFSKGKNRVHEKAHRRTVKFLKRNAHQRARREAKRAIREGRYGSAEVDYPHATRWDF